MRNAQSLCLICVFDGLRPDMIRADWTPNLCRLKDRGVWFSQSHCVFPSVTRANTAALVSGCFPGAHGIAGNSVWEPGIEATRILTTGEVNDLRLIQAQRTPLLLVPTLGEVLAEQGLNTIAAGTGTSGCGYLQHPEAAATGGLVYHHAFATPPELADRVASALGPPPVSEDYAAQAVARVEYAAKAVSDVLIPAAQPALAIFWITVPDGLHHRFGLGMPPSVAAIQAADAAFGRMVERLVRAGGYQEVDIIVTADHGYATVSGHININEALQQAKLKRSSDSTDVVLCADGGSCLVYTEPSVDQEALAAFFLQQPWVCAVFSKNGAIAGALPLSAVGCEGPLAPSLMIALAWDERPNEHGFVGMSLTPGGSVAGTGNHGGISPFEMRNMLIMAGPHFREGAVSEAPCGIVDIAPTVLHCLGLPRPVQWQGRVLTEGLKEGGPPLTAGNREETVTFAGGKQVLRLAETGGVIYTAGALIRRG